MDRGQVVTSNFHRAIYPLSYTGKGSGPGGAGRREGPSLSPLPELLQLLPYASGSPPGSPCPLRPIRIMLMRMQCQKNTQGMKDCAESVARHREGS